MNLEQELRDYMLRALLPGEDPLEFQNDADLIGSGVLDSLAMVTLVTHLEQAYGVRVEAQDIVPENFKSVDILTDFVKRKLGQQ